MTGRAPWCAALLGRHVDVTAQTVVKLMPHNPPRRGDVVLVDGVRCRVTRAKVAWREPGVWKLRLLRVKEIIPANTAANSQKESSDAA